MKKIFLVFLIFFLLNFTLTANEVLVAKFQGIIGPISSRYIEKTIRKAEKNEVECLVILLDTPGGLDSSMRDIVKAELNTKIPVVVFIYPQGARAASAGVFITLAANIAAMSPGTNIGAAHPVSIGKKMDREMKKKVTNDAVAYIESIAQARNRNVEWARDAVRKSLSVSAEDALEEGIIDIIATDIDDLLKKIDGIEIEIKGETKIIDTKDVHIEEIRLSFRENFLNRISNPNIAFILFTVGSAGLVYEFTHPGAIFPGVAGGVCLILAFFSFQTLPVNYAGIALIIMGVLMFFLETRTPTNGPLTVGGVISMLLGSAMLFDTDAPFLKVSWSVIIPIVFFTAAFFLFLVGMTIRAMRKKPTTGKKGLEGEIALVKTNIIPGKAGSVFIHGEFWDAVSDEKIKNGEEVEIVSVEGLKLKVQQKKK
ncbi:MAG: nodulation protein NfeD [Candidatus Cloacimonadota bacterium]|nr:MAG: nodulation protein NfeD [Candidatus Cloacimonadota bacterium]